MGRFRTLGAVAALTLVTGIITIQGSSHTRAGWEDSEFIHTELGSLNCPTHQVAENRAGSKLISGKILDRNIDSLANVHGVETTTLAEVTTVSPSTATPAAALPQAYENPLTITALQALNLNLTGLLEFPLETATGIYRQFAMAQSSGLSRAASGLITDQGTINLDWQDGGLEPPPFATLHLGNLLRQITGENLNELIPQLTNVYLAIGALASYANLEGCTAAWSTSVYEQLERQYAIAGLNTTLESVVLAELLPLVHQTTTSIKTNLALELGKSNGDLIGLLFSTLNSLPLLTLGQPSVVLDLTVDLNPIMNYLSQPLIVGANLAEIDLIGGTITVDLEQLLGPHYANSIGLNGHNPNTQLLINSAALNTLMIHTQTALISVASTLEGLLEAAYAVATVNTQIRVPISVQASIPLVLTAVVNAGDLVIALDTANPPASITLDTSSCQGILCTAAALLINGVLGPVLSSLQTGVLTTVTNLLSSTSSEGIAELTDNILGIDGVLPRNITFLSTALSALFGENAVLSLIVNAQNAVDPAEMSTPAGIPPSWETTLPAQQHNPYHTGRYDVTALRLVALGAVLNGVEVDLARASVGNIRIAP